MSRHPTHWHCLSGTGSIPRAHIPDKVKQTHETWHTWSPPRLRRSSVSSSHRALKRRKHGASHWFRARRVGRTESSLREWWVVKVFRVLGGHHKLCHLIMRWCAWQSRNKCATAEDAIWGWRSGCSAWWLPADSFSVSEAWTLFSLPRRWCFHQLCPKIAYF